MPTGRRRGGSAVIESAARCDMCGTSVEVGPDGRCDLGHRVSTPPDSTSPPVEAVAAETGPAVPPVPAAAETPPPPSAVPEVRPPAEPADDPLHHPYDDVLAAEGVAPSAPAGLAPDELEDLLEWSDTET